MLLRYLTSLGSLVVLTIQGCAQVSGWGENDRGVSYTFGPDLVSEFLTKHDLDLVCRAHQARLRPGASHWSVPAQFEV